MDIDCTRLKLLERSNRLFNVTKNEMNKYRNERLKLLSFFYDKKVNYKNWEKFIDSFEQKIYEENINGKQ